MKTSRNQLGQEVSSWTSREVHFHPYPKYMRESREQAFLSGSSVWDKAYEYAAEFYWDSRRRHFYGTLCIGSTSGVIEISGWPAWVPAWWARRSVVKCLCLHRNLEGTATYHVERDVLINSKTDSEA